MASALTSTITSQTFTVDDDGFVAGYPPPVSEGWPKGRSRPDDVMEVVCEGEAPNVPLTKLIRGQKVFFDVSSLEKGNIVEVKGVLGLIDDSRVMRAAGAEGGFRKEEYVAPRFGLVAARTEDRITFVSFMTLKEAVRSWEKVAEGRSPARDGLTQAEWANHALEFMNA